MKYIFAVFIFSLGLISSVQATHYEGASFANGSISASNIYTGTLVSSWDKGQGESSTTIRVYDSTDLSRSTVLLNSSFINPVTNSSDPLFDTHTASISLDLSSLANGTYVIRYRYCCRISTIANGVSDNTFAVETIVTRNNTANAAPQINSQPNARVAIGQAFNQNLNAFDPDGNNPLTYQFLTDTTNPEYGAPAIPGLTIDASGQLFMSAADTANLANGTNLVAKIRVTDSTGAYTDRDMMLRAITTSNIAPTIDAIPGGNSLSVSVGQPLSITITARDNDLAQLVTLLATGLPANATIAIDPAANPVTATITFTPSANQAGQTFGINIDATDNDPTFPLSTSTTLRIQVIVGVVNQPTDIPVFGPFGLLISLFGLLWLGRRHQD